MAIDPSIALQVKPLEVANPLNQYAQVAQLQSAQNQNALAQYQLGAAQRADADIEALRNALAGKKYGTPEYDQALTGAYMQTGNVKGLQEYQKGQREADKAAVELGLKRAEAERGMFGNLALNPSDENVKAHLQDMLIQKQITPEQAQQRWSFVANMAPAQRADYFNKAAQTADQRIGNEIQKQRVGLESQRVGLEGQRVGLEERRVNLAEKMQGTEGLSPKEVQKREAALPQATSAIKGFEAKSDSFINDLQKLRDHPGLNQITGIVAGRAPALTAEGRAAQALYDKIVAKGGFQALQDLRDASKTGGALGNVSNQEGRQLSSSFAAIQRTQDAPDVRAAIDQAIGDVQGAKTRMREAYDATYSYRTGGVAEPAAAAPAAKPTAAPAKGVKFLGFE